MCPTTNNSIDVSFILLLYFSSSVVMCMACAAQSLFTSGMSPTTIEFVVFLLFHGFFQFISGDVYGVFFPVFVDFGDVFEVAHGFISVHLR